MTLQWSNLRPNFDTRETFEEMVSQIAGYEIFPSDAKFTRLAPPDGGIECFWELKNGKITGWQAKYFDKHPTSGQWGEIERSIKHAIVTYPNLQKYIICMPIDQTNPHSEKRQKTFKKDLEDHFKKWEKIRKKGSKIKFEFWGNHQIEKRLRENQHKGRLNYFFDKEFLSKEWFENHINETVADAEERYTPELNVTLPISKIFDYSGRTNLFYKNMEKTYGDIKIQFKKIEKLSHAELVEDKILMNPILSEITNILMSINMRQQEKIDWKNIGNLCNELNQILHKLINRLEHKAEENKRKVKQYASYEDFSYEIHQLWDLLDLTQKLEQRTRVSNVTNLPLLIRGKPGIGKTHLLCDVATNRLKSDLPTVLIFGSRFTKSEPWSQILEQLGLKCTRDEFLGGLESAAQVHNQKAMIMIDAINEGDGPYLWPKYLSGIIQKISKYSWISLVLTLRSGYERDVLPSNFDDTKIVKITHSGFQGRLEQSMKIFFDNKGISRPSIPVMTSEFSNPQFLMLLVKGLKNKGLTKLPSGIWGLNLVYDFFIESVNEKLSHPERLNLDVDDEIIKTALNLIADKMAETNEKYVLVEDAKTITESLHPNTGASKSLLKNLIREGLLNEDKRKINDNFVRIIQFSYDRFADIQITNSLLNRNLNKQNPKKSFVSNSKLNKIVTTSTFLRSKQGIIESIAIQLPELTGKEFVEMNPSFIKDNSILQAFVNSLMWRNPKTINSNTKKILKKYVIHTKFLSELFEILITVSSNFDHPLNGFYLHDFLKKKNMAERDHEWSIFIRRNLEKQDSIVKRLIEWAWFAKNKTSIDDQSINLIAITITWFFSSQNRWLRDGATKSLVALFDERPSTSLFILEKFYDVNDPYVLERMYAALYGFVLRTNDVSIIQKIAERTYELFFKNHNMSLHLLTRNYARGIIELAIQKKCVLNIDKNIIRPPYRSKWLTIPSKKQISKYSTYRKNMSEKDWAQYTIYNSIFHDDFGRYILGTNSNSFPWSGEKFHNQTPSSIILDQFESSLNNKQSQVFDLLKFLKENKNKLSRIPITKRKQYFGRIFEDDEFEKVYADMIDSTICDLESHLDKNQIKLFQNHILRIIDHISISFRSRNKFDISLAQRWILKRVFDLGWDKKKFGEFDRSIRRERMNDEAEERFGKKYQWIGYYEFLGAVSDHFEFGTTYSSFKSYDGPWQVIHGNDIDPSLLLQKSHAITGYDSHQPTWWFPIKYENWKDEISDISWLKNNKDIPDLKKFLTSVSDNVDYFCLEGNFHLEQPTPIDVEHYSIPRREIWLHLQSYLTPQKNSGKLFSWAKKQNYHAVRLDDRPYEAEAYFSEHFWGNPCQYDSESSQKPGWEQDREEGWPGIIAKTFGEYRPSGNDTATKISNISIPSKILADDLKIDFAKDGEFFRKGKLIAFDPTIKEKGQPALLVNKNELSNLLKKNKLNLMWTLIGQKLMIGGNHVTWKGDLNIYGVYLFKNNKITGIIKTEFQNTPLDSPKRKPTKRKPTKRKPTKRKPTKRKPTKRKPTKRKPTKRKITK